MWKCGMQKIILSPPFCNLKLLSLYAGSTRIVGSYTVEARPGLWRVLTTLKKYRFGWLNNVGLRNPGIDKLRDRPVIVSIAALEEGDWDVLLDKLSSYKRILGVEFNISCPNAEVTGLNSKILARANALFDYVIVKVPHLIEEAELDSLMRLGDFIVHISNTRKMQGGGLSGRYLIKQNLVNIRYVKEKYPERLVIAGGGIYSLGDLQVYRGVGADYFSLSTVLINPIKAYKIIKGFYAK